MKEDLLKYYIEKADSAILDAELLLKNDRLSASVNRIYYAVFYIITALAMKNNYTTSKHRQLIGWFNKNFIATNRIDKKFGTVLHLAYENRTEADYGDFIVFEKQEVASMFEDTKDFIKTIKKEFL